MGSASVGSASVGSARVGARASVGAAPVARAAVRPGPAYDELGPGTPPGGGGGRGGKDAGKAAKKRRRANILTAAAAVVVILLGGGVVAGTWFFDDVQLTEPKAEDQVTQLLTENGKPLATVGNTTRQLVAYQSINPVIGQAVMAAEDKNFREHHGIDMKGILRAAWNNFTGGDTQGASTITQQYARHAAELKEISYNRKLREAVIARKMEDHYSKDEILGRYLNSVYFGRGAYGIEAAVKAYFGPSRSSITPPGKKGAITPAEAAVIASVIKQPEPSAGHKGYDPQNNMQAAQERWHYTLNNMVEKGWLKAADMPTAYPTKSLVKFNPDSCRTSCGTDKATFKIVKYVKAELRAMGVSDEDQKKGGLKITTTINPDVQKAAETAANRKSDDSPLHDFNAEYKTALVAVDPATGQVMAYYGGPDGVGWDYAGPNYNDSGDFIGGGRPPGSSFKVYTLLAALSDGYGLDTKWDSEAKKVDGSKINNSGRKITQCDPRRCPLSDATIQSYNFPFYHLASRLGSDKVAEAAHKAGIQFITGQKGRIDLSKASESELKSNLGNEVGYGQYPITPLDHANGIATLANDGTYIKAHFVKSVEKRNNETGKFETVQSEKVVKKNAFDPKVVAAIDHVMGEIVDHNKKNLKDGYDSIGKSGTWEYKDGDTGENGDAWWVGATRHIAASVWIGREKKKGDQMVPLPIYSTPNGKSGMSGGSVPGETWKVFMDLANKALNAKHDDFPPDENVGDPNKKGNGLPDEKPQDPCAILGPACQDGNQGGQNQDNQGGINIPGFPNGGNQGGNNQPGGGNNQPGGGNNQPGGGNNNPGGGNNNPGGGNNNPGDTTDQGGGGQQNDDN